MDSALHFRTKLAYLCPAFLEPLTFPHVRPLLIGVGSGLETQYSDD